MSSVRYDAHPSLLRMRPFATLLTLALLALGAAVAVLGRQALPASLPPELTRALAQIDSGWVQMGGLAVFGLAVLRLLSWWLSTRSDWLRITDDEILWTHGLLNKQYTEVNLESVRTVRVTQSLFQRLVGAGDVTVFTTGDLPELAVRGLPEPDRIRELAKARSATQA
jgi:uncharacterized membrane protein YdbT with pleckstrin-like domain